MRKPERLDSFYDELKQIHKEYFCESRFGSYVAISLDGLLPRRKEIYSFLKKMK